MDTLFIPAALAAGGLLAVQAGANAQLSRAVGSPFGATVLQLGIGCGVLLLLASLTGTLAAFRELPRVPWWHAAGGTASAFYVVSTILLFPRLGAVTSVGLLIAGQMLASLGLDLTGALGVAARPATAAGLVGTAAVLAGAAAIVVSQGGGDAKLSLRHLGWVALALAAGAVLPVQGAVNSLLRADLGAPFAVGAVSFLVATVAMTTVAILAVVVLHQPRPRLSGVSAMPLWGWLGGFAGAAYVTTVFTAIPAIGTSAVIGLTVAGQQIASVLVDRYGWFRLPRRPVSAIRLSSVGLLLLGVAVIKLL